MTTKKKKSPCSCAAGTWGKQTPPPVCKNYSSPKRANQEGVCVRCEHDELCHAAKPKTAILLISSPGGNLDYIGVKSEVNALHFIKASFETIFNKDTRIPRAGDGAELTVDEVKKELEWVAKKRGNSARYSDRDGKNDIAITNVTGLAMKPGTVIWK